MRRSRTLIGRSKQKNKHKFVAKLRISCCQKVKWTYGLSGNVYKLLHFPNRT